MNHADHDITVRFPGSMRACSMRGAGALWVYSVFDKGMGLYYSLLNNHWLLDSAVYGDDRNDLILVPAAITYKEEPEQYIVASETTLQHTLDMLSSGQSCIWECSKQESRYIVQAHTKVSSPEENTVLVGDLTNSASGVLTEEDLQRARDKMNNHPNLEYYLIGKLKSNKWVFLYMFQRDFVSTN